MIYIDENGIEWFKGPDDAEIMTALQSPAIRLRLAPSTCPPPRSTFDLSSMDAIELENGWLVRVFWDCGDWDYIDQVEAPDGRVWEWGMCHAERPFGCEVFNTVLDVDMDELIRRSG